MCNRKDKIIIFNAALGRISRTRAVVDRCYLNIELLCGACVSGVGDLRDVTVPVRQRSKSVGAVISHHKRADPSDRDGGDAYAKNCGCAVRLHACDGEALDFKHVIHIAVVGEHVTRIA